MQKIDMSQRRTHAFLGYCSMFAYFVACFVRGAAAGAKTEALIAAVSGDLFIVAEQPDAEPESENGDGILSPVDIPLPRFISFSNTEIVSHGVADYYSSNEIRGPPRFS